MTSILIYKSKLQDNNDLDISIFKHKNLHNISMFKVNSIASHLEQVLSHQPCFGRIMPPCRVLNSAHKLPKCVYFKYRTTQRLHVLIMIFEG